MVIMQTHKVSGLDGFPSCKPICPLQACYWFSNGCSIGCPTCDGSTRGPNIHSDKTDICGLNYTVRQGFVTNSSQLLCPGDRVLAFSKDSQHRGRVWGKRRQILLQVNISR